MQDYVDPGDQNDAGKRAKRAKEGHPAESESFDLFGEPTPPPKQRETSAAAHRKVSPEVTRLQELVFACFEKYGPMNDEKLVGLPDLASLGPSTIRTRRSELVDAMKIEATGKTRNSRDNEETVFAVLVPRPEEKAALKKSPLYFDVPAGTEVSRCKYCKRVVFWIKTPQTGSPCPIDCDVDELECWRPDAARVANPRPGRGINHFVTCPLRDLVRADTNAKRAKK